MGTGRNGGGVDYFGCGGDFVSAEGYSWSYSEAFI